MASIKFLSNTSDEESPDRPVKWCIQFSSTDCSTAETLIAAQDGRKHRIERILVISNGKDSCVNILDGDTELIGPIPTGKFEYNFRQAIEFTKGNAIKIQTPIVFGVYIIAEGFTDAYPDSATDPVPIDGAVGVGINPILAWSNSPQIVSSEVFLNDTSMGTSSSGSFATGTLEANTTYAWRVDDFDGNNTIIGDMWTFTTQE